MSEYDFEFDAPKGRDWMRVIPLTADARKHLESNPGVWISGGLVVDSAAWLPLYMAFNREGWRVKP